MQKTLQALVTDVERMLYQSAGPSVQLYAQDVLVQKLQQAFDRCFSAKFWPQFVKREARTLDGVTGKTTAPFSLITNWEDVKKGGVFRRYSPNPIPTIPLSMNTLDLTGANVRYLEPSDDATLFTAYPLTAIDEIVVVGRARPAAEFALLDTVPFDHLALEYWAAWEYSIDDASNPAMAQKFLALFDSRMKQLEDDAFDDRIRLNSNSGEIPMNWYSN